METETVVLCYPAIDADLKKIQAAFRDARIVCSSQEKISKDIFEATIFCGHAKQKQIDWDTVVEQGKLKWIQSSAAGLDHCLAQAVVDSEITVSGCSGLFANQVSEQTLALLFSMIRRMPIFAKAQSERVFERQATDTLHGKTVGILGFGGNGRRVAAVLKNIAGKLLATDSFPDFEPPNYATVLPADKQEQVMANSDVVIVTLPLTPETHKCIGAREFGLMKDGSYFVNVARGTVVDQPALLTALKSGKIAYAGLDVVDPEPPAKDDPVWDYENVLITPHVGAQSWQRVALSTDLFCKNAVRFRNGEILLNWVDKKLQFPRPEHRVRMDERGHLVE